LKDYKLTFTTLSDAKQKLTDLFSADPQSKWRITVVKWTKKRSLSANAQQHLFYGQIAKALGDRTALDVKNFCKDAFGLPLLLNSAEHGDKIEFLLHKLDYYTHSYESKIKLIQCLSVTSELNTAESKIFMDNMIFHFNDIGVPIKYKG